MYTETIARFNDFLGLVALCVREKKAQDSSTLLNNCASFCLCVVGLSHLTHVGPSVTQEGWWRCWWWWWRWAGCKLKGVQVWRLSAGTWALGSTWSIIGEQGGSRTSVRLGSFPPPILLTCTFVNVLGMRRTNSAAALIKAPRLGKVACYQSCQVTVICNKLCRPPSLSVSHRREHF